MILGIDTSNYTTSAAVTDRHGNIITDERIMLDVAHGKRGLRQSEVHFKHTENLPGVIKSAFVPGIKAVCVSARPRPQEGSYMPCFKAGVSAAQIISSVLDIPMYTCSHQEGHILSGIPKDLNRLIVCHFSGGTSEILTYTDGRIEIAGGSLDISFGQLIDRTGVMLGMDFPCGAQMDEMALNKDPESNSAVHIKCTGGYFNLSGIETGLKRDIEKGNADIAGALFARIAECIGKAVSQVQTKTGIKDVLMTGGVSESRFLRERLPYIFPEPGLARDNAVGVSRYGGLMFWQ